MGSNLSTVERFYNQANKVFQPLSISCDYEKEKKKKTCRLNTLKKFLKVRRPSRQHDYSKQAKELVSNWSLAEIRTLLDNYQSMAALKELVIMSNQARTNASSIVEDLALLYENKYCADVDLVYLNEIYPAHRAILCIRCAFFRDLLTNPTSGKPRVEVKVKTTGVDAQLFSCLLRFLYTGSFGMDQSEIARVKPILTKLSIEFGAPNSLEHDLKLLFETKLYSDAVLAFSQGTDSSCYSPSTPSHNPHPSSFYQDSSSSDFVPSRNEIFFPMPCHKAILAARSSFFRNLIFRRSKSDSSCQVIPNNQRPSKGKKTVILLDESVIPSRFARLLLSAVYLDQVDISTHMEIINQQFVGESFNFSSKSSPPTTSCIQTKNSLHHQSSNPLPASPPFTLQPISSSSSSTSSTVTHSANSSSSSLLDEAMELYHIARFLEFSSLAQSCEDAIVDQLSVDNLSGILSWSKQPHGSSWVHRQALHFLIEEFQTLSSSPAFFNLDKVYFIQALKSDFLQASELEILSSIIKWGEQKLVKKIEDQEPNLLNHTTHSVSKKGIKRRDLNDAELRDVITDLINYVRTDHLIPRNHDLITSCVRRGLINPPSSWNGETGTASGAWLSIGDASQYVRPRFFMPFYEEIKNICKEQTLKSSESQQHEASCCFNNITNNILYHSMKNIDPLQRVLHPSVVPDTLYMLDDQNHYPRLHKQWSFSSNTVDIIAGTILLPDEDVVEKMKRRELDLWYSKQVQLAYKSCHSLLAPLGDFNKNLERSISHHVRLIVVREFGLPDSTVEVLKGPSPLHNLNPNKSCFDDFHHHLHLQQFFHPFPPQASFEDFSPSCSSSHPHHQSFCHHHHHPLLHHHHQHDHIFPSSSHEMSSSCHLTPLRKINDLCPQHLPSSFRPTRFQMSHSINSPTDCYPNQINNEKNSSYLFSPISHLSNIATTTAVPDVAMATSSTGLYQPSDLLTFNDLDLGDRPPTSGHLLI